jgi:hypothetical protein
LVSQELVAYVEALMSEGRKFVAVALLTQNDLDLLGSGFRTAFPIDSHGSFDDLLRAIDTAEAQLSAASDIDEDSSKMNDSLQPD